MNFTSYFAQRYSIYFLIFYDAVKKIRFKHCYNRYLQQQMLCSFIHRFADWFL